MSKSYAETFNISIIKTPDIPTRMVNKYNLIYDELLKLKKGQSLCISKKTDKEAISLKQRLQAAFYATSKSEEYVIRSHGNKVYITKRVEITAKVKRK